MMASLPQATALALESLIATTPHGIASRVLARTSGGNVTLFAFDADEELTEHTSPFDAIVLTLEGTLTLTIGGRAVQAAAQTVTLMPAHVPHAVRAVEASRMLLIMLREPASQ